MARLSRQEVNDSRRAGRELAAAFKNGADPTPVQVRLAMPAGEICVGHTPVRVFQWLEGEGEYIQKSGGYYGGGVIGLVALRGAAAIGNNRRKRAAGREAAAQWRQIDQGELYVTDSRFAIQGTNWSDIWYSQIRMSDWNSQTITLEIDGWARTLLEIKFADYWYVMFQKLAYDKVVIPERPDDETVFDSPFSTSPPQTQSQPQQVIQQTTSVPSELSGRWLSVEVPGKVLELQAGKFRLDTPDTPTAAGPLRVVGSTLNLEMSAHVLSYEWSVADSALTLVRSDGVITHYTREPR